MFSSRPPVILHKLFHSDVTFTCPRLRIHCLLGLLVFRFPSPFLSAQFHSLRVLRRCARAVLRFIDLANKPRTSPSSHATIVVRSGLFESAKPYFGVRSSHPTPPQQPSSILRSRSAKTVSITRKRSPNGCGRQSSAADVYRSPAWQR